MSTDRFLSYTQCIRAHAANSPARLALVLDSPDGRVTVTFAEFNEYADRAASTLAMAGGSDGSAIIIVSSNRLEAVVAAAGGWRIGAFVVPLSDRSTAGDIESAIENARLLKRHICLVCDSANATATENADAIVYLDMLAASPASPTIRDVEPDPALAIPSGGTTGRPKLIVTPERWGVDPNAFAVLEMVGWDKADSVLVYSPLYHNVGQSLSHNALMRGKTVYLMDRFDARRAVDIIATDRIEFFFAVPTHMQRILALPNVNADCFASVKSMYHSGAPCPPSVKIEWLQLLGEKRVWEIYGATDGSGFTVVRGDDWLAHPGTVGRAVGCDILVLDEHDNRLPTGEVGQIYMRPAAASPTPAPYYLGAAVMERTSDGFSTVGDMGRLDEEGYLFIADRRTDMIISGGVNIFPAEVEAALLKHFAVAAVAVVGLPDDRWGRRVHAVLVPADAQTCPSEQELDRFLRDELLPYKRPKSYEFWCELPYTDVGKINRRAVSEMLSNSAGLASQRTRNHVE